MIFRPIWNIAVSPKKSQTSFCQFCTNHLYQKSQFNGSIKPSWLWALLLSPRLLFRILPLCPYSYFCFNSKQGERNSQLLNNVPFYIFFPWILSCSPTEFQKDLIKKVVYNFCWVRSFPNIWTICLMPWFCARDFL